MNEIIKIEHLNKTFKDVKAIDDLSFKVKKGEFFAFLGINGAGKSTTISIMCGKLKKDSGTVFIDGENIDENPQKIHEMIGVVYQNSVLDNQLTVYENLKSRATLYNINNGDFKNRVNELSMLLDFKDILNRTYGKLSGGQKRRVDIARALIHNPSILILDEPTTGLDPKTRKLVWQVINNLRKEKKLTVFLTTHYMEEVSDADYIIILNKGKIVASDTPLELKNKYTGDYLRIYNVEKEDIEKMGYEYKEIPSGYQIEVKDTNEVAKIIIKYPNIVKDFEVIKGKMDDVFLNATGVTLGDN